MPDQETAANETFDLPEDHPVLKALRAERSARREERAEAALLRAQLKFPTMKFESGDFEGLTPDKYEARAARLWDLAGKPEGAVSTPSEPQTPQEPGPELVTEEQALARIQRGPDGLVPSGGQKKLGPYEAMALRKRNPAEFERLRQAGQIDLGVQQIDKGGSIVFAPSF